MCLTLHLLTLTHNQHICYPLHTGPRTGPSQVSKLSHRNLPPLLPPAHSPTHTHHPRGPRLHRAIRVARAELLAASRRVLLHMCYCFSFVWAGRYGLLAKHVSRKTITYITVSPARVCRSPLTHAADPQCAFMCTHLSLHVSEQAGICKRDVCQCVCI